MLSPMSGYLHVGVDIGSRCHAVAVGLSNGRLLDEFEISHSAPGFEDFFSRIEMHAREPPFPVAVAMKGYGGHAVPLDAELIALVNRHHRSDKGFGPTLGPDAAGAASLA